MDKSKSFKHIHRVIWPLVKRHDGKFKRELFLYYIKKMTRCLFNEHRYKQ